MIEKQVGKKFLDKRVDAVINKNNSEKKKETKKYKKYDKFLVSYNYVFQIEFQFFIDSDFRFYQF